MTQGAALRRRLADLGVSDGESARRARTPCELVENVAVRRRLTRKHRLEESPPGVVEDRLEVPPTHRCVVCDAVKVMGVRREKKSSSTAYIPCVSFEGD